MDRTVPLPQTVPARGTAARPRAFALQMARYALLWSLAAVIALPFIWMVLTSFKPEGDVVTYPPQLWPRVWTLANYRDIWQRVPFALFLRNSVLFAGGVTLLSLVLDSFAAYALARLDFPGRTLFFWLVLIALMVPFHVTLIPVFVLVFQFGWLNTFAGLIVPRATNAFGIFLLRQFFIGIPRELEDAARIDGAGEFRIYRQIVLPLSKPALATLAVFHFMYNWNDFLWPLIITRSTEMRTLPAGLALFMGQHVVEYAILMAGATIALLPLTLAFVTAQQYFVQGITMTGLKE